MNFQQLRSVREAVRRGFNLTEVAAALHTSQPGVSRQIRELEDELGVELFLRVGKRLTGMTPPGQQLLPTVERLLCEAENLRQAARDCASHDVGPTLAGRHALAGTLCLARGGEGFSAALSTGHLEPAPGLTASDCPDAAQRRGRHRHRHRGAGPVPNSW